MDNSQLSYPLSLLINELTQKHIDSISYSQLKSNAFTGFASFVICGSCYWCASYLSAVSKIHHCPVCNEIEKIESIPLAVGEKYTFDSNAKHGLVLDFA